MLQLSLALSVLIKSRQKKTMDKNMRSCPSEEINEEARCPFANNDNNNDNNFRLQLPGEEALNTIDRSM